MLYVIFVASCVRLVVLIESEAVRCVRRETSRRSMLMIDSQRPAARQWRRQQGPLVVAYHLAAADAGVD